MQELRLEGFCDAGGCDEGICGGGCGGDGGVFGEMLCGVFNARIRVGGGKVFWVSFGAVLGLDGISSYKNIPFRSPFTPVPRDLSRIRPGMNRSILNSMLNRLAFQIINTSSSPLSPLITTYHKFIP